MNNKQLWVHLLAYNVIRLPMAQAASHAGVQPRDLSFKHTVQLWTQWVARGPSATRDDDLLFTLIAQHRVGHRRGRIEPRMRKRRPKPYAMALSDVMDHRIFLWCRPFRGGGDQHIQTGWKFAFASQGGVRLPR